MKIFLPTLVLLMMAVSSAQAYNRVFEKVPPGSWPYSAVARLVGLGQANQVAPPVNTHSMTRYEFAVIIAGWLDSHTDIQESSANLQLMDIIAALRREFAEELARLARRDEPLDPREIKGVAMMPSSSMIPYGTDKSAHFLHRAQQSTKITYGFVDTDFHTRIRECVESQGDSRR